MNKNLFWEKEEAKVRAWQSIKDLRDVILGVRKQNLINKRPHGRYKVTEEEYDIIVEFIGKPRFLGFDIYYDN